MWRDILNFLISVAIGYMVNILSADVGISKVSAGIIAVICFIVWIVTIVTRKNRTVLGSYNQSILRTTDEIRKNAREGLILVVSTYPLSPENKMENINKAIEGDYSWMDFKNTNLAPLVKAIEVNQSSLKHCWMLSTTSSNPKAPGSDFCIPAIVNYLKEEKQIKCEFHTDHRIPTEDDDAITSKTRQVVETIFTEAQQLKIADDKMIADITGGPRSMTLGIFFACLDNKRDIQFIGAEYENARPLGPTIPMITKFAIKTQEQGSKGF